MLNNCYPDNGTTGWWVTWQVAPTRVGLGFAVCPSGRIRECVCHSVSLVICFYIYIYIYILGLVFRINILALAQYLTTARIPEVAPSLAHLC